MSASPDQAHCVVFLCRALYFRSATQEYELSVGKL